MSPCRIGFLSLCRFGALCSSKFYFFCPCAGFARFEVETQCLVTICIEILFPLFAECCASTCMFDFPCSFWKSHEGAFFTQKVRNLNINWSFFRASFFVSGNCSVFLWNVDKFQVVCVQDAFLTGICRVFEQVISLYSYLVWCPPPQELESALGGGDR